MKDTKKVIEGFSFYDHTNIEKHLEKMASEGWLLTKMGNYFWTYSLIEPSDIKFSLTYYSKATEFDPEPSEDQLIYHDYSEKQGWHYLCGNAQMQVFCTEDENAVPIDTDPYQEINAIHASVSRGFLQGTTIALIISLINIAMRGTKLIKLPFEVLTSSSEMFQLIAFTLLAAYLCTELFSYYKWRHEALRAAEFGAFLNTPKTKTRNKIYACVTLILVITFLICMIITVKDSLLRFLIIAMIGQLVIVNFAVTGLREYLKKKKVSADANMSITLCASFILAFAIAAAMMFSGFKLISGSDRYEASYYRNDIPLKIEDMLGPLEGESVFPRTNNNFAFISKYGIEQFGHFEEPNRDSMPTMSYTIYTIKVNAMYEWAKKELMRETGLRYKDNSFEFIRVDEPDWNADEVYRVSYDGEEKASWLLCYSNRLIKLQCSWEPTAEHMRIAGEKLSAE